MRALTLKPGDQARGGVGQEEEDTERLILPDMDALMRAEHSQNLVAFSQDDMAKRDAREAELSCPRRHLLVLNGERDLACRPDAPKAAAEQDQHEPEHRADDAARERPQHPKNEQEAMVSHVRSNTAYQPMPKAVGCSGMLCLSFASVICTPS